MSKRKHGRQTNTKKRLLPQQIKLKAFEKQERKKLKKSPVWD